MIDIITMCIAIVVLLVLLSGSNNKDKQIRNKKSRILMDTSGIIDARFFDIASTGFITAEVIVPKFVLQELQTVADAGDSISRARAREGMDKLNALQNSSQVSVSITGQNINTTKKVDEKLIELAKKLDARLYTTDFNLIKRSQIEGVSTLNVNDLAHSVRVVVLPGEELCIKIVQIGSDKGQGVAYLDDGTMVVVDKASDYIGKEVWVVIQRVIQTAAGKMFFADLKDSKTTNNISAKTRKFRARKRKKSSE